MGSRRRQREARLYPRPCRGVLGIQPEKAHARQKQALRDYFVENVFAGSRSVFDPLHARLDEARRRLDEADKLSPSTMVMQDMPKPRDIFVLVRGAYDRKGEKVLPGVPGGDRALRCLPNAPLNRLALARWIVDSRNPLTGPRDRQPFLAALFRHGHREDGRRLRRAGGMAHASGTARLAGDRIRAKRLEREAHAAADRHVGDLSAIVARQPPRSRSAIRKIACWLAARGSAWMRKWSATRPWPSAVCS